jgi:SAM-dependent methyltransferase
MMERRPEPELMDDATQARAYAEADFEEPNSAFCAALVQRFAPLPETAWVADLGAGPADIPIRLARRFPHWHIDAIEGSRAMLEMATAAVAKSGVGDRLRLISAYLPDASLPGGYDIVLSNSLLHHLGDPRTLWRTAAQLGRPGANVLVMDLRRPETVEAARDFVERYAASEPTVLRRDFYNSLLAAFTVEEVEQQLAECGLPNLHVEPTSDRHLVVFGTL